MVSTIPCGCERPQWSFFGEIDAMACVLVGERLGPVLEVRLEGGDRIGPLAAAVEVVTEQQLRVVARGILAGHLHEQRYAGGGISRQRQLRAERGEHLLVGGCQRLRAAHQLDALLVLLARGVHRGPQHVGVDASRVERDRLIERLGGVVELVLLERGAALVDQRGALVVALVRALRVRGRSDRRDRQNQAHQEISTNSQL